MNQAYGSAGWAKESQRIELYWKLPIFKESA